jgi:D-glycero-alpha-D-manno-heptose-7-phosphate kinase
MIISRTPFRVSFAGGGTDLPGFYRFSAGAVVSTAIDKYMYVTVNRYFDDHIILKYSETELVSRLEDIRHPILRECLRRTGLRKGIEITSMADVVGGTGLGSSSSFTVGVLHALHAYKGEFRTAEELAREACEVEIGALREPIGKQDQYIAALGGMRDIRFGPGEKVEAEEVILAPSERRSLQQQVMLFYTGTTRNANTILSEQTANVSSTLNYLHQLRDLAATAVEQLRCGDIDSLGPALRAGWETKRHLASGVSNESIDLAVGRALAAGASGAKITGAGGGGFVLVICPVERQRAVRESLSDMRELPIKFDSLGTRVVLNVTRDIWS